MFLAIFIPGRGCILCCSQRSGMVMNSVRYDTWILSHSGSNHTLRLQKFIQEVVTVCLSQVTQKGKIV